MTEGTEKQPARACKDCKHFMPDGRFDKGFLWWRRHTLNSARFAMCGVDLYTAKASREFDCHGNWWEPK